MRYRVVKDYTRQYDDPISFERGESIAVEREDKDFPGWWWCTDKRGKSGWVHENFFEEEDYRTIATEGYSALELSAKAGEALTGLDERSGWALCVNQTGEQGWVPLASLANIEAA